MADAQINDKAQQVLQNIFGFSKFRSLQSTIVHSAIAGHDNFVLMPTGGGKSLCYQIPAIVRPGTGLVVSPLVSLMQDQVQALQANGVAAACLNSTQNERQARQTLAAMHNGELDLLYLAPERLLKPDFLQRLHELPLSLIAIDEAHCLSQWGHDFRPEYRKLGPLRQQFNNVPLMALTATADKQTRADILSCLQIPQENTHIASFNRPNISYTIMEKHKPFDQLKSFLGRHQNESGIIYCLSRKRVEQLANKLQQHSYSALPYHAGLGSKQRQHAQMAFQRDEVTIMVATIAFGMGIDKPNVRFVVHYDLPKHIEGYYQETGRAGRDGLPAEAFMLYGLGDMALIRGLIANNSDQDQQRIEMHKLNCMAALAEAQTCRRQVLLNYFNENLKEPCGNCDVCLNPPTTFDGLVLAQKALSCIYRVGQRFGVQYVIAILRGQNDERIKRLGHDRLSTFGIGKDTSIAKWHSIFRQLIHLGYIEQDIAQYSILRLTPNAGEILRGQISQLKLAQARTSQSPRTTGAAKSEDADYNRELFELLRQKRKELAQQFDVPPFVIFSDATLIAMAAKRPTDDNGLLAINGVGEKKLSNYGPEFLTVLRQFDSE